MLYRLASLDDSEVLGELNHQLIQDEGHRNPMTIPELVTRMRFWRAMGFTDYCLTLEIYPDLRTRNA
jgi:hypothetical protein